MKLRAYFDETQRTSAMMAVGGIAFVPSQERKFTKEWTKLFPTGFHMTELMNKKGRFKGFSPKQTDKLLKDAIAILADRMSFGVAVSCNQHEFAAVVPLRAKGLDSVYSMLLHMGLTNVGILCDEVGGGYEVEYTIEDGPHTGGAKEWLDAIDDVSTLKRSYCHVSHRFAAKTDAIPLAAADLFAWEWAKYRDETVWARDGRTGKKPRPIRKSLAATFMHGQEAPEFNNRRFKITHLEGPTLAEFGRKLDEELQK
jgi:hypothetical protein